MVAAALLGCLVPALAQQALKSGGSANAAPAKVADTFQHPLGDGKFSENYGDADRWYVSGDFGDPLGESCDALESPICYKLGEDWKRETGGLNRPVYAVANGTILDFGYAPRPRGRLPDSLGNYVLIRHTLPAPGRRISRVGWVTTVVSLYAYLSDLKGICGEDSMSCKVGQPVEIGALIGHVGRTGAAKGASLHFEIRLTEEKCLDSSTQTTANASCLGYSKQRYPVRYAKGGGWVDPTCFLENKDAPRNDDVADAILIDVGVSRRGSNLCATREDGEPNHAGKRINTYGLNANGKSVWWKFTAPKDIQYTVSTAASEFDTLLSVYASSANATALVRVARNDNEKPTLCEAANYCTSKVTFTATAGTTYYIAVDGARADTIAAASGPIRLTVAESDSSLFVTPSATSLRPGYEGGPFTPSSVNYQVSASEGKVVYSISNVPAWLTPSRTFGNANPSPTFVTFAVNDKANSLKAGIHTATIVFGSSNSQRPQTRTVTLKVREAPSLLVASTVGISASGKEGGPFNPVSFPYAISATAGTVKYRISGVPSWLNVSSSSGTVTKTATTVAFTVNSTANSLQVGTYNATIYFKNVTNGKGSTAISAVLTVKALPKLQVAPATEMVASGLQGGPFNPLSFPYQLNATTGQVNYSISGVPSWLTVSSPSGTVTTTPTTVTFTVNSNATGLAAGTHNAIITVVNSTNGEGTKAISAVLNVNALPKLQVVGTSMAASGPQGGPFNPFSFSYQLSATTGTVNYSISGMPSWLTVSSASGTLATTPTTVTFTVNSNANNLTAGAYNAAVTFINSTNGQGTTSRPVDLTVSVPPPINFLTDGAGAYLLDTNGAKIAAL